MKVPGLDLLTMALAWERAADPWGAAQSLLGLLEAFLDAEPESRDGRLWHSSFGNGRKTGKGQAPRGRGWTSWGTSFAPGTELGISDAFGEQWIHSGSQQNQEPGFCPCAPMPCCQPPAHFLKPFMSTSVFGHFSTRHPCRQTLLPQGSSARWKCKGATHKIFYFPGVTLKR